MKKIYLIILLCTISAKFSAQTYSSIGLTLGGYQYDTINSYEDTLKFVFSGLNAGAFGQAKLRITYAGDFGASSEFLTAYLPDWTPIAGQTAPNAVGNDCETQVDSLYFNAALINNFLPLDTFYLITSPNVDLFCIEQRVKVELIYDYCIFGTPTYASFSIPNQTTCSAYAPQTLVGSPAGGTFSGVGMSGNVFNPAGLTPGNYGITYTATDLIGCTTSITNEVTIANAPEPISELVCSGSSQALTFSTPHVFANDILLASTIDTASNITFSPIVNSPTNYYYATYSQPAFYMIDTIIAANFAVVDHDITSGDDRGGILIGDTNVYILGDNGVSRFNLNLQNEQYINIDNDGMFNDLTTRKIYSFSNAQNDFPTNNFGGTFVASKIIELDVNLVPTGVEVPLSQNITIGFGNFYQSLMLSGFSEVMVSDVNNDFYKLEIVSGNVALMGQQSVDPYGSENWMSWGVLGYDGSDYHAFYRSNFSGIVDYNFGTQTEVDLDGFNDWSDLASFTVDEQTNRLYFHYEGGTSTFGGLYETLGYTDLSDTLQFLNGVVSCPSLIQYTFNSISLGADTTICDSTEVFVIEPGFGYSSYTWNGVNNNWNVFPVSSTSQVILEVVDDSNCNLVDTITVNFDPCDAGLSEMAEFGVSIYPNPNKNSFTVNAGLLEINSIQLFDMNGKMVGDVAVKNATITTINHQLENGLYLVRIVSGNSTTTQRIVVQ